ncbi:phage capsid protein [Cupriavidus gilardii]|uniref:major capsid protein n=1 Tax=Cupriavidus gilardii TaxID=82541 RepID=UPI001EE5EFF9|nr:phage capsid protein [Cupriavidus gilardii]MCG5260387.1 phage capsid protein [Cupriavidus gilardii]MDF9428238.1 phage capsid protein [Cupriavidus gilardii]
MDSPFPQDTQLTAIAVIVRNQMMIADEVLPRTAPLGKEKFSYQSYPAEQQFTVPDTKVGRRSQVNEVEFSGKRVTDETEDHGLDHPLPISDINNAPANTNIEALTTEMLSGLIILDREVRTSRLVFNKDSYAGNSEVVSATDRFDAAGSDPVEYLLDVLDRPIMRPNIAVIGQSEWRLLRTHPAVVKAVHGNNGDKGAATRQQVAELLEIEDILVGRARVNYAKPGKAAELRPCWRGGMALIYQDKAAAKVAGVVDGSNVTFGFTAQYGTRVAGSKDDSTIGLRGGRRVRVGESVKEVICAPHLGFFLQDVITPAA